MLTRVPLLPTAAKRPHPRVLLNVHQLPVSILLRHLTLLRS